MDHRGEGSEIVGKGQMSCNCQNLNSDLSAGRINSLLFFIIIVINGFRFPGLEFEVLTLNY